MVIVVDLLVTVVRGGNNNISYSNLTVCVIWGSVDVKNYESDTVNQGA